MQVAFRGQGRKPRSEFSQRPLAKYIGPNSINRLVAKDISMSVFECVRILRDGLDTFTKGKGIRSDLEFVKFNKPNHIGIATDDKEENFDSPRCASFSN